MDRFFYFTSCNCRPSLVVDIFVITLLCLAGQSRRARKPKTSLVEDPEEVVEPDALYIGALLHKTIFTQYIYYVYIL